MMPPPLMQWKLVPVHCPSNRHSSRLNIALAGLSLCVTLLVGGCGFVGFPGVYKIDVEQGNLVLQDMVDQLRPGMSRRQVRFIMGSPLVEDTFHPDRWDYPYVIRNGQNIIREAQVTILFDGDTLAEIRGDYLPDWAKDDVATDAATEATAEDAATDDGAPAASASPSVDAGDGRDARSGADS